MIKELRTPGLDAANCWFAFIYKMLNLIFTSRKLIFLLEDYTFSVLPAQQTKFLEKTFPNLSSSWISISMVGLLSFKYIHAEVLL